MRIKSALISVFNKTGLLHFVSELNKLGIDVIATRGTFDFLVKNKIASIQRVSDVTNFPEILSGRVKTMHPTVLGGILASRNRQDHLNELEKLEIKLIDMVICNWYPFEKAVNHEESLQSALEKIDIGGPNLIRAAAKNYENVVVITNTERYCQVLEELKDKGDITIRTRFILATEAFKETANYDSAIWKFFKTKLRTQKNTTSGGMRRA